MSYKKNCKSHIDQLEITYTAPEHIKEKLRSINKRQTFDCLWLERQKPRHYDNEFAIWFNDWREEKGIFPRLFAYLYFDSPNPNRKNIYISYTNEAFYGDLLINSRFYVQSVLGLKFKCISKLDIAVDFSFNIQRSILKAYKDENYDLIINGQVVQNEKVKNVGGYAANNSRQRPFSKHEFLIYNKEKTLTMKCYDKAKEIEEESHKQYIIGDNAFTGMTMYRLEMSCKNYKMLHKTLVALKISDEELYSCLGLDSKLIEIFNHLLWRIIRLRKGRKSFKLLEVALKDL